MFDFVWNLNENEFENFKEKQRTYKESNYDGGWIGNVRCGLLCFDIIDFDTFLHFDLYVGGVDTGYGYSDRLKDQPDYPYDFCSTHSLHIEDSFTDVTIEEFKVDMEPRIVAHLLEVKGYFTDRYPIRYIDLIKKANKELLPW